jgi:hypothetical protein
MKEIINFVHIKYFWEEDKGKIWCPEIQDMAPYEMYS